MNKITGLATVVALLFAGSSASAATYVANRAVGTGSVNLSITTDDTLGVLSAANILDFTIIADNGITSANLSPALGSQKIFSGNGLTATATDLFFNFDGNIGGNSVYFQSGNGLAYFAWQGSPIIDNGGPAEVVFNVTNPGVIARQVYSGNQIVASVADNGGPGAVPEPATWAMMIMGFGAAGSLLRRRRAAVA